MLLTTTGVDTALAWLASIAIALGFVTAIAVGTRYALRRARGAVDPPTWILAASLAGGSVSVLTLALL